MYPQERFIFHSLKGILFEYSEEELKLARPYHKDLKGFSKEIGQFGKFTNSSFLIEQLHAFLRTDKKSMQSL